MTAKSNTEEFTDITDQVDELLARPEIAEAVSRLREERMEADRGYAVSLAAVRKAFNLTQVELARNMGVSQPAITKMEHQSDMLISTLCSYMGALDGQVRLVVDFPNGQEIEVTLRNGNPELG